MTKNIETTIILDASVEEVWKALSEFDAYHRWNPRVQFKGTPCQGAKLKMAVKLFGIRITVPVLIEVLTEKQQLRWRGGIPGIFTGSHYFKLREFEGDKKLTRLIQGENFEGNFVPLLLPFLRKELGNLYENINSALQSRLKLA